MDSVAPSPSEVRGHVMSNWNDYLEECGFSLGQVFPWFSSNQPITKTNMVWDGARPSAELFPSPLPTRPSRGTVASGGDWREGGRDCLRSGRGREGQWRKGWRRAVWLSNTCTHTFFDMQHDPIWNQLTLTWGQNFQKIKLTFQGQIIYRSIRLDEADIMVAESFP